MSIKRSRSYDSLSVIPEPYMGLLKYTRKGLSDLAEDGFKGSKEFVTLLTEAIEKRYHELYPIVEKKMLNSEHRRNDVANTIRKKIMEEKRLEAEAEALEAKKTQIQIPPPSQEPKLPPVVFDVRKSFGLMLNKK